MIGYGIMDILIAVPTFETINPETFKSIFNLKKIPGVKIDFDFVKGYDCARARNKIAEKTLEGGYDYVLMVDSDVILPSNTLDIFTSVDYPMILGYSPRKDDASITEIYKPSPGWDKNNRYLMSELINSDIDFMLTNGGSFGCAWIDYDIFNRLTRPYFDYRNYPDGQVLSEDLYFCSAVRDLGIDIFVSTKVRCKHIAKQIIE